MKHLIVTAALALTACTTGVPVSQQFPDPPERAGAYKTCGDLKTLTPSPVLSDVSRTVADNYAAYHECRLKLDIWLEWYQIQRSIFEKAK